MKLPARLHVSPSLLVVARTEQSVERFLTYSPGLAELASVDYFIRTIWNLFSFNHVACLSFVERK